MTPETLNLPFHLQLLVREYGQSTYQLIQGLRQIDDVAERTRRAAGIVQMMLRLRPSLRELPEVQTRLWNHLYAMAGEEVQLDAPVPLASPRLRTERPKRIEYPRQSPKLKAYGKGVEALVAKALTLPDAEREQAAVQIGRTMKFLFRQHNKENAKDTTILRHLAELSGGQLRLDAQVVADQGLFELPVITAPSLQPTSREGRPERTERRNDGDKNGKKNNKKRKKFRSEVQQPPQ